jgi:hypothetical protein
MTVVARQPGEVRRRTGGLLTALGGAAIVAGSFADWVRADISTLGIREGTGWRNVNGNVAHGPWFAALGAVLVVIGACFLVGLRPRIARVVGTVLGLVAIGLAIYEIYDITRKVTGVTATVQPGLWIVIVGAGVALLGLVATSGTLPPSPTATGPAVAPMPYPAAPPSAEAAVAAPPVMAPPMPPPEASPAQSPGLPPVMPPADSVPPPPPPVSPPPPVPPADPTLLG